MTSNDLATWLVIYGVIENTELKPSIHFAQNNHLDAQKRLKNAFFHETRAPSGIEQLGVERKFSLIR